MGYIDDISVLDSMPWLSDKRKMHIVSTAETAQKLAEIHCPELSERAFIAGLYHDCAKGIEDDLLSQYDTGVFSMYPSTLHAPLGAYLAKKAFGVNDELILEAIKWHCTGKESMNELEKIVFLADAIEPYRVYPNVETIRKCTYASLDAGVRAYVENLIAYLKEDESKINPYTLQCYEFYREQMANNKLILDKIVNILDFHKGERIAVVDISEQTVIADYFVIAQGSTIQQVKSMADYLDEDLKKFEIMHNGIDGYNEGKWIVMDYGDVIVQLFRKEERDYYNIERLWENGGNIEYI